MVEGAALEQTVLTNEPDHRSVTSRGPGCAGGHLDHGGHVRGRTSQGDAQIRKQPGGLLRADVLAHKPQVQHEKPARGGHMPSYPCRPKSTVARISPG